MMTKTISIPKPCHEDWGKMLPEQQGRHCLTCSKTVIDFSGWHEDDILDYLKSRNTESVCGRFNASQLQHPEKKETMWQLILESNISLLRKIAAIVLLCFGAMTSSQSFGQEIHGKLANPIPQATSAQRMLVGKPAVINTDSSKQQPVIIGDTVISPPSQIMGMVKPYPPAKTKKHVKTKSSSKRK